MNFLQSNSHMSRSKKKQVLLCGTQYGQTYLNALDETHDFEVCALLAKGSDHSIKLSEQRAINLYTQVDQIDETVDLACVAIGGDIGANIAIALLKKTIPVLIEHPVSVENSQKLLKIAKENNSTCNINCHFTNIYPVVNFIELCRKLNAISTPNIINVACNSRTLFSMLDILMRCFGRFSMDNLKSTKIDVSGFYQNCTLLLNGLPCSLVYQKWRSENDDSKDSPLGHEITITYPQGVLRLAGTFGPCQWFPLIAAGMSSHFPVYSEHINSAKININTHVVQWRIDANKQAVRNLYESHLLNRSVDSYQKEDYLIHLCMIWTQLFSKLGTVEADNYVENTGMALTTIQTILDM